MLPDVARHYNGTESVRMEKVEDTYLIWMKEARSISKSSNNAKIFTGELCVYEYT